MRATGHCQPLFLIVVLTLVLSVVPRMLPESALGAAGPPTEEHPVAAEALLDAAAVVDAGVRSSLVLHLLLRLLLLPGSRTRGEVVVAVRRGAEGSKSAIQNPSAGSIEHTPTPVRTDGSVASARSVGSTTSARTDGSASSALTDGDPPAARTDSSIGSARTDGSTASAHTDGDPPAAAPAPAPSSPAAPPNATTVQDPCDALGRPANRRPSNTPASMQQPLLATGAISSLALSRALCCWTGLTEGGCAGSTPRGRCLPRRRRDTKQNPLAATGCGKYQRRHCCTKRCDQSGSASKPLPAVRAASLGPAADRLPREGEDDTVHQLAGLGPSARCSRGAVIPSTTAAACAIRRSSQSHELVNARLHGLRLVLHRGGEELLQLILPQLWRGLRGGLAVDGADPLLLPIGSLRRTSGPRPLSDACYLFGASAALPRRGRQGACAGRHCGGS